MEQLSKECYADQNKMKYPIFNKLAALKSFNEFRKDVNNYSIEAINRIAGKFIKAAKALDIVFPDIPSAVELLETYTTLNGTVRMSKVASAKDISSFVDQLDMLRESVSLKDLRKIASDVLSKTQDILDSEAQHKLELYAGMGVGDESLIYSEFRKRASLIPMPLSVEATFNKVCKDMKAADTDTIYKNATHLCDMLDTMDRMYKLEQYYGSKLKRPEEVCFKSTVDDLIKEASDYLHINSTDTILSKKALLENKSKVCAFLEDKYNFKETEDDKVLEKVASLSKTGINALINYL